MYFLNDPTITFVGIWNGKDAPMLERDHGLCVNTMDLRFLVADKLQCASMETLASDVLGLDGVEKRGDIARRVGADGMLGILVRSRCSMLVWMPTFLLRLERC